VLSSLHLHRISTRLPGAVIAHRNLPNAPESLPESAITACMHEGRYFSLSRRQINVWQQQEHIAATVVTAGVEAAQRQA